MFWFLYFHNSSNLDVDTTGICYQEWKNLGAGLRTMVAEIKPVIATNIIFTTVVVSLPTWKYQFLLLQLRHFIPATKIRNWRMTSFARHLTNSILCGQGRIYFKGQNNPSRDFAVDDKIYTTSSKFTLHYCFMCLRLKLTHCLRFSRIFYSGHGQFWNNLLMSNIRKAGYSLP